MDGFVRFASAVERLPIAGFQLAGLIELGLVAVQRGVIAVELVVGIGELALKLCGRGSR